MTGMPPSIPVDPNAVIRELISTDLGRALWERAQWRVAAEVLQDRVTQLENQPGSASPATDRTQETAGG